MHETVLVEPGRTRALQLYLEVLEESIPAVGHGIQRLGNQVVGGNKVNVLVGDKPIRDALRVVIEFFPGVKPVFDVSDREAQVRILRIRNVLREVRADGLTIDGYAGIVISIDGGSQIIISN